MRTGSDDRSARMEAPPDRHLRAARPLDPAAADAADGPDLLPGILARSLSRW